MTRPSFSSSFSLVERSIVLVILALLMGDVLTGQNLMHAAEICSIAVKEQRIIAIALAFKDQYGSLPGDVKNATAYWGAQDATPATCKVTASTTVATCDGDRNGQRGPPAATGRSGLHCRTSGRIQTERDSVPLPENVLLAHEPDWVFLHGFSRRCSAQKSSLSKGGSEYSTA